MAMWNSRGLRGSSFEEMINYTIEVYRNKHLALIQKIPTPIKPITIEKESRHITLAYFDQKSTVDYIGSIQGIPVCFDAKESHVTTFPLQNIHDHQIAFMSDFEEQGGVSFILIYYTSVGKMYYLPYRHMMKFWQRAREGGRKSFTYDEIDTSYEVFSSGNAQVHFLTPLQKDLLEREG